MRQMKMKMSLRRTADVELWGQQEQEQEHKRAERHGKASSSSQELHHMQL
jgi:hypothetical protein